MINKYLDLVYGTKSEFQKIHDIEERKRVVCAKLNIDFDKQKTKEEDKEFRREVLSYLVTQCPLEVALLSTRQELFVEMLEKIREPLIKTTDEDKILKAVKMKGEIDQLCGRLVMDISNGYKAIYHDVQEDAKVLVKKTMEERLKTKTN